MSSIEMKVKASTAAGLAVGVLVTVLNAVVGNSQLMGSMPSWAQSLLTLFGPPLATFLAGFYAPHSSRLSVAPKPPEASSPNPAA
ncbi:holin [Streptomyces sp. NPDC004232]|uniref:holin n=1 Tax=Streptomyces sp. NPDC004232 TaxID=3154454 RepID=UPI00339FD949